MRRRHLIQSGDWLTAAAVLIVALPVLVVLVQALTSGWAPDGDRGVVAARAYDVLSAHPPLSGEFTRSTFLTGVNTYSPGPLLYWLLAVPAHLPGLWALPTTMAVVNGASVVGSVLLARRRGGPVFMVIVAAAMIVMLSSLPTDLPTDIWSPSAPVLPFTLLVIVAWSVACGDVKLLPLAVLLASFTAEIHIAYLFPAVLMLLLGTGGLLVSRRLAGSAPGSIASPTPVRRWALIALLVAVVCWSSPVVDQVLAWTGSAGHGNLAHLVKAAGARGQTFGLHAAAHAVVRTVGVVPWWLRTYLNPAPKTFEIVSPVSTVAVASTVIFLVALGVCLVLGWRRRRVDVVTACAFALVLIIAVAVFTASFPKSDGFFFTYGYTSWWAAPAGMWVWLLLGWSVVALTPLRRPARIPARAVLPAVTAAALIAVPLLGLKSRWHAIPQKEYPALRAMMALVRSHVPDRGPVLMVGRSFGFDAGVVYELRRKGLGVGTPNAEELGTSYLPTGRHFAQVLEIGDGTSLPQRARVIGQVTMHTSPPRTVTLGFLYPR